MVGALELMLHTASATHKIFCCGFPTPAAVSGSSAFFAPQRLAVPEWQSDVEFHAALVRLQGSPPGADNTFVKSCWSEPPPALVGAEADDHTFELPNLAWFHEIERNEHGEFIWNDSRGYADEAFWCCQDQPRMILSKNTTEAAEELWVPIDRECWKNEQPREEPMKRSIIFGSRVRTEAELQRERKKCVSQRERGKTKRDRLRALENDAERAARKEAKRLSRQGKRTERMAERMAETDAERAARRGTKQKGAIKRRAAETFKWQTAEVMEVMLPMTDGGDGGDAKGSRRGDGGGANGRAAPRRGGEGGREDGGGEDPAGHIERAAPARASETG